MRVWDFPPEYGTEEGDRCGRGLRSCPGRMVVEERDCDRCCTLEEDPEYRCEPEIVTVCNICGTDATEA